MCQRGCLMPLSKFSTGHSTLASTMAAVSYITLYADRMHPPPNFNASIDRLRTSRKGYPRKYIAGWELQVQDRRQTACSDRLTKYTTFFAPHRRLSCVTSCLCWSLL